MNEQDKQAYLEKYAEAKKKGVPFFPDIIFKDAVISLIVFIVLVGLAYFIGAPLEKQANPADTSYTPRPEWYFLFLFQLLKYFPGDLEVIGVIILPTLAILLLFALPFLDRSRRRYPFARPVVIAGTSLIVAGIVVLTFFAIQETPPPAEATGGDQTAALYAENCAPCHGPSISVPADTNLHDVIAQGKHEGMPAWSGDLTSNEIDALAGFILSPGGSQLFTDNCSQCHKVSELVAGNPLEIKNALTQGSDYPPHADVDVPAWNETLSQEERTALLNFLIAPDGQRLFAINCSPCHGRSVAFSGEESDLRQIISNGGMHLSMPPWQEKLSQSELDTLARYVVKPSDSPEAIPLFNQYCAPCHGRVVPNAKDVEEAKQIIATGGGHETMPVWGNILTQEQIDALVQFTLQAARGTSVEIGQDLFSTNCSPCHGALGEGGLNPARPGDIIAPISSAEYLKTRDDFTLRSIISQGQPELGMSPFGTANGGPLDDEQIDALIAYLRSWEQNPPVENPPEIAVSPLSLNGADIYQEICAQCHGPNGEGSLGPALNDPTFQDKNTDEQIFDTIKYGHASTAMIGWGEVLNTDQIQQLVEYIRQLRKEPGTVEPPQTPTTTASSTPSATPTFTADIQPILQAKCVPCHGNMGGWDASSYDTVMNSGDNAPVIIPGDSENSLLAHKILGTQTTGLVMPPSGKLPLDEIQLILDWIDAGAPR